MRCARNYIILCLLWSAFHSQDSSARCFVFVWGGMINDIISGSPDALFQAPYDRVTEQARASGCQVLSMHDEPEINSDTYPSQAERQSVFTQKLQRMVTENNITADDKMNFSFTDHGFSSGNIPMAHNLKTGDQFGLSLPLFFSGVASTLPQGIHVTYATNLCWPQFHQYLMDQDPMPSNTCGVSSVDPENTSMVQGRVNNTNIVAGWNHVQSSAAAQVAKGQAASVSLSDFYYGDGAALATDSTNLRRGGGTTSRAYVNKISSELDITATGYHPPQFSADGMMQFKHTKIEYDFLNRFCTEPTAESQRITELYRASADIYGATVKAKVQEVSALYPSEFNLYKNMYNSGEKCLREPELITGYRRIERQTQQLAQNWSFADNQSEIDQTVLQILTLANSNNYQQFKTLTGSFCPESACQSFFTDLAAGYEWSPAALDSNGRPIFDANSKLYVENFLQQQREQQTKNLESGDNLKIAKRYRLCMRQVQDTFDTMHFLENATAAQIQKWRSMRACEEASMI